MLKNFRKLSETIYVKIIIVVIILSFVLWGIGDIFRSKMNEHYLKIGSQKISESYLQQEINSIKAQNKTTDEIGEEAYRLYAIQNIIKNSLIDQEAKNKGINISKELIFSIIREEEQFKDENGNFSPAKFKNLLISYNLSEKEVFSNIQKQIISDIIDKSFKSEVINFKNYNNLLLQNLKQERNISLIKLPLVNNNNYSTPSEPELLDFYTKTKQNFLQAEYREVSVIDLSCTNFTNNINISEIAQKDYYDTHKDSFKIAEAREIKQLFAADEKAINLAYEELNNNIAFQVVAQNLNMNENDIEIGLQTQSQIFADFAQEIFNLSLNQHTKPIKGPYGWHIFKVQKIKPETLILFEEAKAQIKKDLTQKEACKQAKQNFDLAKEQIDIGTNINDLAAKLQLELSTLKITQNTALTLENFPLELQEKFKLDIFSDNQTNQINTTIYSDDKLIIYQINAIYPERYLALDEIRGKLITNWQEQKNIAENQKTADKIYDLINDSANKIITLNDLKTKYKLIIKKEFITRNNQDLTKDFVELIFKLNSKNKITKPILSSDQKYFLFAFHHFNRTKQISADEELFMNERLKEMYKNYLNENISNAYIMHLTKQYKVEIKNSDN
ncbi:MAG: SurA N-terminal domain-containing protein [Rickettsiales bacterium]